MYIGSWKIDDLVTFTCNTHTAATGAATDADSPPTYRVYEDETGTPILTGSMALLDGANTAGFYSEQITLSAANGFEKGKSYNIYISATVAGITGTMHHALQLEAEVDAHRLNWANIDNPTTTQNLSATNIDVDQVVASVSGAVASVTGNVGGNVAGSVGSVTGAVGSVAAGGITAASFAANALDAVWSAANRLLTAGTNIVLAKGVGVTGFNDLSAAQVNAEVVDVLTVDTFAEPSGAPAATSSLKDKIGWSFKLARNLRKTTSAVDSVYNDAGAVVDSTAALSDDGTTFTRGEYT